MSAKGLGNKDSFNNSLLLRQWSVLFFIFNSFFIILLSQRYTLVMDTPATSQAWLYYITLTLGHFSFLLYLIYLFITLPVILLFPRKKIAFGISIILTSLFICIITIDTFVFSQYRFHISPFFIQMLIDTGDQIIDFPLVMWLTVLFSFILLVALEILAAELIWKHKEKLIRYVRPKLIISSLLSLYLTSHIMHIYADSNYDHSITSLTRYYPLLFPATAKSFMIKQGWAGPIESQNSDNIKQSGNLLYPIEPIRYGKNQLSYNILYIVLDSWRFDAMSAEITPNIYKFSQKSLHYKNHFSAANGTRTGIFSMFYGLPGNYWHSFESNQLGPVLIDAVIDNGYETGIYASAPLINPEFDRTVFKRIPHLETSTNGKTVNDRDENALSKWLNFADKHKAANNSNPFFGFLFLDSLHAYQLPPKYPLKFTPSLAGINYFKLNNDTNTLPLINFYKNITHYVDSLVGKAISNLEKNDLLKNTIVIITSDHGQEINDNKQNYWGHNSNFSQFQTQVPLIIHWPDKEADKINKNTSHYDLTPTLISNVFKGSVAAEKYSIGRDLFSKNFHSLESIIMTSFSMMSIYDFNNNVMMVKNKSSSVDYFDLQQQHSKKKPSPSIIKNAINDMNRFYK